MTRRRFVGRYRCSRLALAPATILGGQGPLLWAFSLCPPPIQSRASFCHLGQAIYRSPRLAIQVSAHPSCWCHALIEYITRDSPHHRPPTHHLPSDILITYRCKLGPYALSPTQDRSPTINYRHDRNPESRRLIVSSSYLEAFRRPETLPENHLHARQSSPPPRNRTPLDYQIASHQLPLSRHT